MQPPIRLGIIGSTGRFGRAISALAASTPGFCLAKLLTHPGSPHLNAESGFGIPFTTYLQEGELDVLIDASLPSALPHNLQAAVSRQLPLAIGVTGLKPEDFRRIEESSAQIPIFYASNFSLGMALLRQFAALAAKWFPSDIHLVETHHTRKKDAPSGSALTLSASIAKAGKTATIESVRSGDTVGKHELFFNAPDEQLCLTHTAHRRDAFASGVLVAARFLLSCKPGLYGMDDLLQKIDP